MRPVHAFRLVGKEHCITIERDAQLAVTGRRTALFRAALARQQGGRRVAGPEGLAHRLRVSGEKERRAERAEVAVAIHAAREHRAPDVEPVPGDRVKYPEPCVHAVA